MLPDNSPYLIAETAYNHEGDFDYLKAMVNSLPDSADAVKFHLLMDVDGYMHRSHPLYTTIINWTFSDKQWKEIFNLSISRGKDIIALCDDPASIEFILENYPDIAGIELHATGLNDIVLLELASRFRNTVILGIGGSQVEEILFAIDFLRERGKQDIFLMYGFQSFPTNRADVRFDRMLKLKDFFGLPMGYADHTSFDDELNHYISALPCGFGINIIEKHFTLDKGKQRIDFQSAVSIDDLSRIKQLMQELWQAYGKSSLSMSEAERDYGAMGLSKKVPFYKRDKKKGESLSVGDIIFLRAKAEYRYPQYTAYNLIGKKLLKDVNSGSLILPEDFEN